MSCCGRKFLFTALYLWVFICGVILPSNALASFASQFSLSIGEEYNDNIFFTKQKEHDFITYIFPTLSLLYAPAGQTVPTFAAELTPIGQVFARHGGQTNFGDNIRFKTAYTYNYSPRLTFQAVDTLRRLGETRTGIGDGFVAGSSPIGVGVPQPQPLQGLGHFTSGGDQLSNQFSLGGRYAHSDNVSFTGNYTFGYNGFLDQGGRDLSHSAGFRGVYNWKQEHNLYAGYTFDVINSRNGDNNVVHNFDIGDDYLSSFKIELAPTLTVLGSGGIAVNSRSGGPRISSRVNLSATKIWERAALSAGVNKGLTPSFGVAGISDTTSFFTNFNIRVSEFLTGFAGADYSFYDTDDVNFKTFQASTGLQYRITSWLGANLSYAHHRLNAGSGATSTDLLSTGKANSNSIFLSLTSRFDIWPNVGLARVPFMP